FLAQVGIGVAEDTGVGVMDQEGQQPLLPPAPLGNVVFFNQSVVAVEGNGVEIEVEGRPPGQLQAGHGVEPGAQHLGVTRRVDAAAVVGQERTLGDDVESGEQGQSLIEDRTHDVGVAGPKGFKASKEGRAQPAGIIAEPGKLAWRTRRSKGTAARLGRNRNSPPNWVRKARGARSSWRTSATSAVVGREPGGRSSSRRRGRRAKPSSLRRLETAAGLRGWPSSRRVWLMS